MPSFKSDSSFFHKIAMGAIGSRAVKVDLAERGHIAVELERGSLDAKIWKGVKRKRVRIPDLVCSRCGQRIEVRTKSEPELAMSHSPTVPERRWDYGMVGSDLVAIPICVADDASASTISTRWTRGLLSDGTSYLTEKEWIKWQHRGCINYFSVEAFRRVPPDKTERKGAEEGSETTLVWRSCFSPSYGKVVSISEANITIEDEFGERKRKGVKNLNLIVGTGDTVALNQILACNVTPQERSALRCEQTLTEHGIAEMLRSQHLPIRFAGVKLARIRDEKSLYHVILEISQNFDEDIYVRLEAKAYLAAVHNHPVLDIFATELSAFDKSDQLEAVIAIGEIGNESAAVVLAGILNDPNKDYFLRSAAAYCIGRIDSPTSRAALIHAFTAHTHRVREDALTALADSGLCAIRELLLGLENPNEEIQAGCAEAIRWLALRNDRSVTAETIIPPVARILSRNSRSLMAVWLGGQLPETLLRAALSQVLGQDEKLAYSLAVSWAFARSWIMPTHDSFNKPQL